MLNKKQNIARQEELKNPLQDIAYYHNTPKQQSDNMTFMPSQKKTIKKNISHYLWLFMKSHIRSFIVSFLILSSIFFAAQIVPIYMINMPIMLQLVIKLIPIIISLFIGMTIIRLCVLKRTERISVAFFNGFFVLSSISLVSLIVTMTCFFMMENILALSTLADMSIRLRYILAIIVSSFISAMMIARFSFWVPSFILCYDHIMYNLFVKDPPYISLLFFTTLILKIICLSSIIFLGEHINIIVALSINAMLFAIYHLVIFSLIGVSFKISFKKI